MMVRFLAALTACVLCASDAFAEIEIKVVENQMIVTGTLDAGDGWTFGRAVSNNPQVDTIVLRDMPGGKVEAMERIAATVEERKLNTVVSARCASACAHIFLAGEKRQFSKDFPPQYAYLAFHGGYRSEGSLKGFGGQMAANSEQWYVKRSGGKLDADLVKRWLSLEHASGAALFYYPSMKPTSSVRTAPGYLCSHSMPLKDCEPITKDALQLGLISTDELAEVKDVPYWDRARYTNAAPVDALRNAGSFNEEKTKTLDNYQTKMKTPKALALSRNGDWMMTGTHRDGHSMAIVIAIGACQSKAKSKCHVIAIDDELAYSAADIKARKFD